MFANWGYTPLHGDVVPTPGTVSVNGNTVALTNPGQPTTFGERIRRGLARGEPDLHSRLVGVGLRE